jgi:hypothetical protein
MTFWDWFKREKFELPDEKTQVAFVEEIREKLKTAKGAEKTKLTYMLANQLMFLNQILNKKRKKKPIRLNNKGRWVWVEDDA